MDCEQFAESRAQVVRQETVRNGIGTLGEKTLHAVLKRYFEPDSASHEVKIGSFVADIVSESGIIEIQTQSLDRLRKKLADFLACADVTVVYPVAQVKWLCWIDPETGEVTRKRKSPKRGSVYDAFRELYKIKGFLTHPGFRLCIPLLEITEYRYLNGWSADRKKGSSRCDRIPEALLGEVWFTSLYDFEQMVPEALPAVFTTRDYAAAAKLRLRAAQTAVHVLYTIGTLERVGKDGRLHLYQRAFEPKGDFRPAEKRPCRSG